jgi:hypothetical protein
VARRLTIGRLPHRIGPVEIERLGSLFALRCPHDLDSLMRSAGGIWEPGSRAAGQPGSRAAGDGCWSVPRWSSSNRRSGGRLIRCFGGRGSIWMGE